jgi:hypothetical protein
VTGAASRRSPCDQQEGFAVGRTGDAYPAVGGGKRGSVVARRRAAVSRPGIGVAAPSKVVHRHGIVEPSEDKLTWEWWAAR